MRIVTVATGSRNDDHPIRRGALQVKSFSRRMAAAEGAPITPRSFVLVEAAPTGRTAKPLRTSLRRALQCRVRPSSSTRNIPKRVRVPSPLEIIKRGPQ